MSSQPAFLPRVGDLKVEDAVQTADRLIREAGGKDYARVYFKFTCMWCGERCTFVEPYMIYEKGECAKCKKDTPITVVGLRLEYPLGGPRR